jgi:hypothetical protein
MRGDVFGAISGLALVLLACGGSVPETAAGALTASEPIASALQVTLPPFVLE